MLDSLILFVERRDIAAGKRQVVLSVMWQLIQDHSTIRNKEEKIKLLSWLQQKIPFLKITNLTTDWNDGRAIGALVNALAPG